MYLTLVAAIVFSCCDGQNDQRPKTLNPGFAKVIDGYLEFSVPVISVDSLFDIGQTVLLLDARQKDEYLVSHLPGARHIGYKYLDLSAIENVAQDTQIVVYCSIGYRSEKVAKKLMDRGYHNVSNLYGSIFEWVNHGYTLETPKGQTTKRLHTYNKKWSKWVEDPGITKTW